MIKGNFETREVRINGKLLNAARSLKIRNHSPNGFNWGYEGSGPAQFALGLLLRFSNKEFAAAHYQDFKREVIARLPQADFVMDEKTVLEWISERIKAVAGAEE